MNKGDHSMTDDARRLVEEGPDRTARRIPPADAGGWPRVIIVAHADGRLRRSSLTARDREVRIRSAACLMALTEGLKARSRAWIVLEGPDAAPVLPTLDGIDVLGADVDVPLTPLFAFRAPVDTDEDPYVPLHLIEDATPPDQAGFLHDIGEDGPYAVPLDRRYGVVARALLDGITIRSGSWDDEVPGPADLVPAFRFEGETLDGLVAVRGRCALEPHGLRVAGGSGGGAEARQTWLTVRSRLAGPSWLVPPDDLWTLAEALLIAVALYQRHDQASTTRGQR
jgi:hypothetical protein